MSDVVNIVAIITPAPGKKELAQAALAELAQKVQENEPNCLQYQFFFHEETGEFISIERFKNMAALEFHRQQPYLAELKERAIKDQSLAKPLDIRVLTPTSGFTK
ncbi:hypothetical protein AOQ84DRAFT_435553 [Glonium stellatum]|uniref:ABM domain-containing protein n=1 Tax=Glonium stellatum TaxID=574774 RepID=A0A8E2FDE1_9PEZI|nr:hypothetical protein AOQ84DRAFT_435553 [Glonium stellatum]